MPRTQARPLVEHLLCVGHATPLTELPPSPDHPPSPPAAPGVAPAARLQRSKFAPALLSSHPASRPFLPGPNAACSFCLPSGLRLALGRRPPPSFGCFVLTDDGYNRLYGHTLTVYVSVPADTAVHTLPPAGATAAPPPAAVGASSRAGATPPAGNTGGGLRRDTGGGPRQEALRQLYSEEHYVSLGATPEQARAQVASATHIASEPLTHPACRPPRPPPPPSVGALAEGAPAWAPRCICLISSRHEPLAFKTILQALASLGRSSAIPGAATGAICSPAGGPNFSAAALPLPLETALMHLVEAVPLPIPGGASVRFELHPSLQPRHLGGGEQIPRGGGAGGEETPGGGDKDEIPLGRAGSDGGSDGGNAPGNARPGAPPRGISSPPSAPSPPASAPSPPFPRSPARLPLPASLPLFLSAPSPADPPPCDYTAALLLGRLKPPAVLKLLTVLLLEWQLVVVSDDAELRMGACELLLSWLHPFAWVQAYVPTMPDGPWLDLLQAPFPFLIGLTSSQLAAVATPRPPRLAILHLPSSPSTHTPSTNTPSTHTPPAPPAPASLSLPSRRLPALPAREAVPLTTALHSLSRQAADAARQTAAAARTIDGATATHPDRDLAWPPDRYSASGRASVPPDRYSAPGPPDRYSASGRSSVPPDRYPASIRCSVSAGTSAEAGLPTPPPAHLDDRARAAFLSFFASMLRDADRLRTLPRSHPPDETDGRADGTDETDGAADGTVPADETGTAYETDDGRSDDTDELDRLRSRFVASQAAAARPFAEELARTQHFAQLFTPEQAATRTAHARGAVHHPARVGSLAFQSHLDLFLARRVAAFSSLDKRHVAATLQLATAARAAAEAAAAPPHRPSTVSSARASDAASPAGIDAGRPPPAGIYAVPPPLAAEPLDPAGYRYPDHLPCSFPPHLQPVHVPLPWWDGALPPPPPPVADETRAAWADALAKLERRADQRQVEQKVGAGIGAGALVGGALAATALGCQLQ